MVSALPSGIQARGLTKVYGETRALDNVSLDVQPGEIAGLLGPNGAGKTTAIECILGLRQPDSGSVTVAGFDAAARNLDLRGVTGALLQSASLQDKMTPREALQLFGSFYPAPLDPERLLSRFGLQEKAGAAFQSLSGGQKQRLFLALALVNDPGVLLFDEPTAGLDPQARRDLHGLIAQLAAEGRAVLLSTHDLDEAARLCHRVFILHHGRIVASDTPAGLLRRSSPVSRLSFRPRDPVSAQAVKALPGATGAELSGNTWIVTTTDTAGTLGGLAALAGPVGLEQLQILQPSLEDAFLEITGQPWTGSEGGKNA